jgi:hypothetical protein
MKHYYHRTNHPSRGGRPAAWRPLRQPGTVPGGEA